MDSQAAWNNAFAERLSMTRSALSPRPKGSTRPVHVAPDLAARKVELIHSYQSYVIPYTPEQNGLIERFFRSLKEKCVWQHSFTDFAQARQAVTRWIDWYDRHRPHQSLKYLSPAEFRSRQAQLVA